MSKSYGNAVELGEDPEERAQAIMVAVTDPARKRRNDPGHPEVCPIYWLHRAYSPPQTVELVDRECRTAGIGCVDWQEDAAAKTSFRRWRSTGPRAPSWTAIPAGSTSWCNWAPRRPRRVRSRP